MIEKTLRDIDLASLCERRFTPSPYAWEDQVLYFLLLDRFSDGREHGFRANDGQWDASGTTPAFRPDDENNAIQTEAEAARWREAGGHWVGGNLRGLTSKMGYLQRLGVTALWVSPIFKQVTYQDSYHGYGIQNFIDIDPHFGTREDLQTMVKTAHEHGIYVILDIILNHVGDVFRYKADRYWTNVPGTNQWYVDPRWDGNVYEVSGFHDAHGEPTLPFGPVDLASHPDAWPDGAIWPAEFQNPDFYTRKGRISNWDNDPEYLDGDFYSLKDIRLGYGSADDYTPSAALAALCQAYKVWIAYADIDGYRIDTVKHMDLGATRFFTSAIHEFTQRIGKENFYLIGEITGGRVRAFVTLDLTGLDAALGIDDIPDKLEYMVKGYRNPREYFDLFRNSLLMQRNAQVWFRDKVVTLFDDHDQVRKGQHKARFCAGNPTWRRTVLNALVLNATSMGIPCIYYGTEQSFDGAGDNDRYIREAMFGGEFGAFRSRGRHFFNEDNPVYRELARIHALRRTNIALRRGRQYLREISGDGERWGLPAIMGPEPMRAIVPWSRIIDDEHVLVAINTDPDNATTAWVTLDRFLHSEGQRLRCLYSTEPGQIGDGLIVQMKGERKAGQITVPAGGCMIFE